MEITNIFGVSKKYGERVIPQVTREDIIIKDLYNNKFTLTNSIKQYLDESLHNNYYCFNISICIYGEYSDITIRGEYDDYCFDFDIENTYGYEDYNLSEDIILNILKENHDDIFNIYDVLGFSFSKVDIKNNTELFLISEDEQWVISINDEGERTVHFIEIEGDITGDFNPGEITYTHTPNNNLKFPDVIEHKYYIPLNNGRIILNFENTYVFHRINIYKKNA